MQLAPQVDVTDRVPGFLGVTSGYADDAGEDLLAIAFGAELPTALYVGLTSCDVYELRRALDGVIVDVPTEALLEGLGPVHVGHGEDHQFQSEVHVRHARTTSGHIPSAWVE